MCNDGLTTDADDGTVTDADGTNGLRLAWLDASHETNQAASHKSAICARGRGRGGDERAAGQFSHDAASTELQENMWATLRESCLRQAASHTT